MEDKKVPLIDQILLTKEGKYDKEMEPLIVEGIQNKYKEAYRQGKVAIFELKKNTMKRLFDISNVDVDDDAENMIEIERNEHKLAKIADRYIQLFGIKIE